MVSTETMALNSLFRKMRDFLEGEDLLKSVKCIVDYDFNRIIVQPNKPIKQWPQQDENVGVVDEMTAVDMDSFAGFPSSNDVIGGATPQTARPPAPGPARSEVEEAQEEPLLQEMDSQHEESRSPGNDQPIIPVGSPFPANRPDDVLPSPPQSPFSPEMEENEQQSSGPKTRSRSLRNAASRVSTASASTSGPTASFSSSALVAIPEALRSSPTSPEGTEFLAEMKFDASTLDVADPANYGVDEDDDQPISPIKYNPPITPVNDFSTRQLLDDLPSSNRSSSPRTFYCNSNGNSYKVFDLAKELFADSNVEDVDDRGSDDWPRRVDDGLGGGADEALAGGRRKRADRDDRRQSGSSSSRVNNGAGSPGISSCYWYVDDNGRYCYSKATTMANNLGNPGKKNKHVSGRNNSIISKNHSRPRINNHQSSSTESYGNNNAKTTIKANNFYSSKTNNYHSRKSTSYNASNYVSNASNYGTSADNFNNNPKNNDFTSSMNDDFSSGSNNFPPTDETDEMSTALELWNPPDNTNDVTNNEDDDFDMDDPPYIPPPEPSTALALPTPTKNAQGKYECQVCELVFRTLDDLNAHHADHADENLFMCTTCSYTCKQAFRFQKHQLTHTEVKPYKCPYCPYTCRERGRLKIHSSTHTGLKPYKCNSCTYSSATRGDLKKHILTHTGEKPYKCPTCPYSCRESGRLKKHIATHTGEKPYRCHTCHYSSTTCGDLKKHLMTHTGEKPFKCPSCPYSCRESGRLKKHMSTHNA